MDAEHDNPRHHDPSGSSTSPGVLGLAAVVTLGVIPWLYGVHAIVLAEANTWAGHVAHALRDSLLAFPLAVLAVGAARWPANRWGLGQDSVQDRLGQAALISLMFALLLVPSVGAHEFLDRWLDGGSPGQAFHGHGLRVGLERATDVVGLTLHGFRDALVGLAAAFPVTILGLASGQRGRRREVKALRSTVWAAPARLVVPAVAGLVVLGLGATALTFTLGEEADPDHAAAAHQPVVTQLAFGSLAEVGGLRFTVRSAKWVSIGPEMGRGIATPVSLITGDLPDRLYLEFAIENLGNKTRSFERKEVRLQGPSGAAWGPLADDFPAITLGPQEALTTMLIFEVPVPEAGLQLAWVREQHEAHIPIATAGADREIPKTRDVTQ